MFEGFETQSISVDGACIHVRTAGEGAPLLLLHGYPQTHVMWHGVAEHLARTHQVIASDLRGYGDSVAQSKDFTFRAMAADQVAVMRALGHERFHVIAHDRGARVAHRMALDHPEAVASLMLLDILPTLDVWRYMDAWLAQRYYHWTFLAQPDGMPEKLINSDPVMFLHAALAGLSGQLAGFAPEALAAYEQAAKKPSVVAAWCGDYRAGAGLDLEHDRVSFGQTREIPCHLLWGTRGVVDHHVSPLEAWRVWFPKVTGRALEAGHFLVEEQTGLVLTEIQSHLAHLAPI